MKLIFVISMSLAFACCRVGWCQDVPDSNNFLLGYLESRGGGELIFTYAIGMRVFVQQEHALNGSEIRSPHGFRSQSTGREFPKSSENG